MNAERNGSLGEYSRALAGGQDKFAAYLRNLEAERGFSDEQEALMREMRRVTGKVFSGNGSLSEDDGGEMLDGTYNPCEIVEVTTKSQPGSDYLLSEVFNLRVGREVFQRSVDEEWYITEADIKDFLKEHVGNESLQDFAGPDDLIQYFLALYDLVMENEDLDVECRERHEDREKRKRLKNLSRFMKKYKGPHRTLSLS